MYESSIYTHSHLEAANHWWTHELVTHEPVGRVTCAQMRHVTLTHTLKLRTTNVSHELVTHEHISCEYLEAAHYWRDSRTRHQQTGESRHTMRHVGMQYLTHTLKTRTPDGTHELVVHELVVRHRVMRTQRHTRRKLYLHLCCGRSWLLRSCCGWIWGART